MKTSGRPPRRLHAPRLLAGLALLLGACAAETEPEPPHLLVASLATPDLGFYKGFYLPLDNEVMYETDDVKVTANGNLALSFADAQFEGAANEDEELDDYRASINLRGALTVELSVEGGGAIEGELELLTVPLGAFTIGPNVEVIPYASVRLLASGTVDADARVSLIAPFSAGSRVSSPGSNGSFSSEPQFEPEIGMPELIGNFTGVIDVDVTMSFMTTVFGIPVGGPFIGTRFGAELVIDTTTSTWDLDARGVLTGGWATPDVAGLPVLPENPPLRRDLGDRNIADGAIPDFSTSWSQVYDIDNDDEATAAIRAGDGLIVAESAEQSWLGSLDGDGVPGWQGKRVETVTPRAMAYSSNGDLLVAGTLGGGNPVVELYSTTTGAAIWRNEMSVPAANHAYWYAILPTADGGAILGGEASYGVVDLALFAAVDATGALLWQTEMAAGSGSSNPKVRAMAWTPSGDILAVGQVNYATPDPNNTNYGLVLRLDASGVPQSALAVGSGSQIGSLLAANMDGSYTIAGTDGRAPYDVWIASMRANDTLAWSASYQSRPETNEIDNGVPTGLAGLSGSGLLVSGHIGAPNQDAWVMRIDRAGMPMFVKTYSSTDDDELSGVLTMPGGFAAFGSTGYTETNSSYSDLWLIRAKVDGMIHFTEGNGFETHNTAVQWQRSEGHEVHVLAPQQEPTTLTGTVTSPFTFNASTAVGELLTD